MICMIYCIFLESLKNKNVDVKHYFVPWKLFYILLKSHGLSHAPSDLSCDPLDGARNL